MAGDKVHYYWKSVRCLRRRHLELTDEARRAIIWHMGVDAIDAMAEYSATYDKASIIMAIEDVEPVEPVTHAHWKRKFKREGVYEDLWLYCSNCNSRTAEEYAPYWWTYCPYCGAIMDEKEGKE